MASKEFEALSITEWKISSDNGTSKVYRVFKSEDEFETVEAENASDAIAKCGTTDVHMVKYGSLDNAEIVASGMLSQVVAEADAQEEPEAAEASSEEAPNEAPVEEASPQ